MSIKSRITKLERVISCDKPKPIRVFEQCDDGTFYESTGTICQDVGGGKRYTQAELDELANDYQVIQVCEVDKDGYGLAQD